MKDLTCSACSGALVPTMLVVGDQWAFDVDRCERCGAIHRTNVMDTMGAALAFGIGRPMLADAQDATYFDVPVQDSGRVHGWYSPSARRVVQYG